MKLRPKAQRLQRLMNSDDFDTLQQDEAQNLIDLIMSEARDTCKIIKDNVPFSLKIS